MNTEYSYLDIYPSQRIARYLIDEDPECRNCHNVLIEAGAYIQIMEEENLQFLRLREGEEMGSSETYKFLRSQERTRNTKLILQYLCAFLSQPLPLEQDMVDKPVNPFEQMKFFVLYNIDLIKEKDVSTAILREHERLGLLNDTNAWYYRGQIDKSYRGIRDIVESASVATVEDYCKIFIGLQRLCNFWFSVRNEEIKRIRKSDSLLFKLSRYLLEKYKK